MMMCVLLGSFGLSWYMRMKHGSQHNHSLVMHSIAKQLLCIDGVEVAGNACWSFVMYMLHAGLLRCSAVKTSGGRALSSQIVSQIVRQTCCGRLLLPSTLQLLFNFGC
jgi:hypothetical protein